MFFILSKVFSFFIYPLHFIFGLILLYIILKKIKILKTLSKFILFIVIFCLLIGGSGYISNYLLWNLENKVKLNIPNDVTGIILLGGSFHNVEKSFQMKHVSLNEASERIVEAYYLLNKFPKASLIMVANSGSLKPKGPSEAEMARLFFEKFNVNKDRLFIEPLANNTYQESIFISEYISNIGGNWILVTSASHMPRSINLFQSRNLNKALIFPYPTDYSSDKPKPSFDYHLINLGKYKKLIHEYLGILVYWITGRTQTLWPNLDMMPVKS